MSSAFKKIIMMANQTPSVDTSKYLTIEALEDGLTAKLSTNTCQYSTDGVTWTDLAAGTTTPAINAGDKLYFKATGLTPIEDKGIGTFTMNKKFNLSGNCNSMLFGDYAATNLDLTGYDYAFATLFANCKTLQSVSRTFLPATTLANFCYYDMFGSCTALTTAPELPATTLADWCYCCMFHACNALTTAPSVLPATTLTEDCYDFMFANCLSLTTAPVLPATTLVDYCYFFMFYDCYDLNYIKMLATDISASECLTEWVNNVSSTGTFVKNANATWTETGKNGIPYGWTVTTEQVIIEFTIDSISYQAKEGMTWKEWVNSEYNTDGYFIPGLGDNPIYTPDGTKSIYKSNDSSGPVFNSEVIISQGNYITKIIL